MAGFVERVGMPDTEKDDPETKRQGQELLAKLP
jgi:hypothetical protein